MSLVTILFVCSMCIPVFLSLAFVRIAKESDMQAAKLFSQHIKENEPVNK